MKNKLNQKLGLLSREEGFTLIELLIVIAIISILVAIAVPALNTAKSDAQAVKRDEISASVATAKVRAHLKDNVSGNATFAQFSKYLLVNGRSPSIGELANSQSNGAGSNITSWGTYPDSDGNATPVVWGSAAAVTN